MAPLRTGITLAITVAVFYALCTLVWVAAPGPFLGFMNNLFHGVDFSNMVQARAFSWQDFLAALLMMSLWALLTGSFFAWLQNRMVR